MPYMPMLTLPFSLMPKLPLVVAAPPAAVQFAGDEAQRVIRPLTEPAR